MSALNEPVSSSSSSSSSAVKSKGQTETSSFSRVVDFTLGWPSKSMHIDKELLHKSMQVYLDKQNDHDYHSGINYGLNQGPLEVRCAIAEWLNDLYNSINLSRDQIKQDLQEKQSKTFASSATSSSSLASTTFPKLTDSTTDSSGIGYRSTQLFLTGGVSDAMRLCCSALIDPCTEKNIVLCEDPTFFAMFDAFTTFHGQILPVECSSTSGINVSYLRELLTKCREHNLLKRIAFLYLIPFYHNPLGVSLSVDKLEQIIKLAHEFDIWIISDEIYLTLNFPHRNQGIHGMSIIERIMYPNLKSSKYKVLSLSGISKVIGPGFRCGWVHTFNDDFLDNQLSKDGILACGGCLSNFTFSLLKYIWTSKDINRHLQKVNEELYRKCTVLYEEINNYNKMMQMELLRCENIPSGGYFIWIELTGDMTSEELKQYIEKKQGKKNLQINFTCGNECSSSCSSKASQVLYKNDKIWNYEKCIATQKQCLSRYVRLCFAYLSENELREGGHAFAESVYALYKEKHPH